MKKRKTSRTVEKPTTPDYFDDYDWVVANDCGRSYLFDEEETVPIHQPLRPYRYKLFLILQADGYALAVNVTNWERYRRSVGYYRRYPNSMTMSLVWVSGDAK